MGDVPDLMREHAGKLGRRFRLIDQRALELNPSARQREGIGIRFAHDRGAERDRQCGRRFELADQAFEGLVAGFFTVGATALEGYAGFAVVEHGADLPLSISN